MIDIRALTVRHALTLGFVALMTVVAPGYAQQDDYSKANQLLFMTDQLANVDTPATLDYRFQSNDATDEFDDHITLDVRNGGDDKTGGKHVTVDFLSGDRNRYVPDIDNAHGNPVIMLFLQHDVTTLAERTGGSWRYFQRRVKFALENDATVKQETATYDGRDIDVERIYLQPYAEEQDHREDMKGYLGKRYVFTLSKQVPGGVLEMRSERAGDNGEKTVERLRLNRISHDDAQASDVAPRG